ncbi:DUF5123 domain-containing protein [Flavobacterium sp. W22_SRS_FK3]|uniref:DUF5123 domain-containing protein n=1 Tax=Flavobacterium sp. W22_SRS_FK3 TaxID=3240275 RepID=UPI003F933984
MKKTNIFKGIVATSMLVLFSGSCDSYTEDVITELSTNREFSPTTVKAIVRNQTSVELSWDVKETIDHYVVEVSADDPNFTTILKTLEVTGKELPVTLALEGETLYSIRVKAISGVGLQESKWSVITATTLSEQLFLPIQNTDIASKQATLRWTAGSNVTKIVVTPGEITHVITDEEKAAGVAIVTGLSPETNYQADLFNGNKRRGATTFSTGVDIGDGILIENAEELKAALETITSGAKLFLMPGDYQMLNNDGSLKTEIALSGTITISSVPGKERPVLHCKISANAGTNNISLLNLVLDGSGIENASVITVSSSTAANFGDFLISGCSVHDYTRSILGATAAGNSTIASFTVENSEVTNVNTNNGAEFINVRNAYITSLVLKNSTFNKCSNSRDFIRMDAVAAITGKTSNVLIDSCTFNLPDILVTNRFMYVRFANNICAVRNTLFSNTLAFYSSNQTGTTVPTFSNNNYFNSPTFQDSTLASNKVDAAGTSLNPGFTNASAGDFTISNQTLIDNRVGDPRWIK